MDALAGPALRPVSVDIENEPRHVSYFMRKLEKLERLMHHPSLEPKKARKLERQRTMLQEQMVLFSQSPSLLDVLGGATDVKMQYDYARTVQLEQRIQARFSHQVARTARKPHPQLMERKLSDDAHKLIEEAFRGLEGKEIVDYHTHVLGTGCCSDTGCFCPEPDTVVQQLVNKGAHFYLQR
jgi:hypothetical protein